MSYYIWCELVCGGCSTTTAGHFTKDKPDRRWVSREAWVKGWVRHDDEWLCKTCSQDPDVTHGPKTETLP